MSSQARTSIPNILTIAGLDPSGGAGILADIKAMSALGGYGNAVVVALTAQNTQTVNGVSLVNTTFIEQQIDTLFDDVRIDSVKIGMLGTDAIIETVAQRLLHYQPAYTVLDPVMIAKSGAHLLEPKAVGALREILLPMASVITPNLPEAAMLLEQSMVERRQDMYTVAEKLRNKMSHSRQAYVFLKGGHLPGEEAPDLLFDGDRMIELFAPKILTQNTHGTGCTLSAALATLLPQSSSVEEAARAAKAYIHAAIEQAHRLSVGAGHGPVHHFHAWW